MAHPRFRLLLQPGQHARRLDAVAVRPVAHNGYTLLLGLGLRLTDALAARLAPHLQERVLLVLHDELEANRLPFTPVVHYVVGGDALRLADAEASIQRVQELHLTGAL